MSALNISLCSLDWRSEPMCDGEDTIFTAYIDGVGRITVLDRMTGFGYRDIESGFKDLEGKFWLASGGFDIRSHADHGITVSQAIEAIKTHANTCIAA